MNQEQRDRLAGIAERMRTVGRMAYPNPVWFADYAAEIEALLAEPAEAQPPAGSEYVLLSADEIKRDGDEFWSPFSGWCRCLAIGCQAADGVVRRRVAPQAAPTVEALISGLPPARSDMDAIAEQAAAIDAREARP